MDIFEKITSDDLEVMGHIWADKIIGDYTYPNDEAKDFLYDIFTNGFLAGAIQLRAIIEEFENEKEAE